MGEHISPEQQIDTSKSEVVLTELEEHVLVVLDDAVEVVLRDHQNALIGLDLSVASHDEA